MPLFCYYIFGTITALLPALLWLWMWYKKDNQEPEPKQMIVRSFFLGMLAVLPFFGLDWQWDNSPHLQNLWKIFSTSLYFFPLLLSTFSFAFLEESLKHFAVLRLGKHLQIHFTQVIDGVIYSVAVALGFSFAENLLYFISLLEYFDLSDSTLWNVVIFRSIATTFGHSLFSGIFGLFWGHAFVSDGVTTKHSFSSSLFFRHFFRTFRFHIIRSHILRNRISTRGHEKGDLVREGLLLATIVHTLFNLFLEIQIFGMPLTPFVVPLLVGGFLYLRKQFLLPNNIQILQPVRKEKKYE